MQIILEGETPIVPDQTQGLITTAKKLAQVSCESHSEKKICPQCTTTQLRRQAQRERDINKVVNITGEVPVADPLLTDVKPKVLNVRPVVGLNAVRELKEMRDAVNYKKQQHDFVGQMRAAHEQQTIDDLMLQDVQLKKQVQQPNARLGSAARKPNRSSFYKHGSFNHAKEF